MISASVMRLVRVPDPAWWMGCWLESLEFGEIAHNDCGELTYAPTGTSGQAVRAVQHLPYRDKGGSSRGRDEVYLKRSSLLKLGQSSRKGNFQASGKKTCSAVGTRLRLGSSIPTSRISRDDFVIPSFPTCSPPAQPQLSFLPLHRLPLSALSFSLIWTTSSCRLAFAAIFHYTYILVSCSFFPAIIPAGIGTCCPDGTDPILWAQLRNPLFLTCDSVAMTYLPILQSPWKKSPRRRPSASIRSIVLSPLNADNRTTEM